MFQLSLFPAKLVALLYMSTGVWAKGEASVGSHYSSSPLVYIRYILGTIFILWLPGYAFIKALFPEQLPIKTSEKDLDIIERTALSVGMSLALVPMVGLLLNYTPWGIRLTPIVLSLVALTVVFALVAVLREHQIRISKKYERNKVPTFARNTGKHR